MGDRMTRREFMWMKAAVTAIALLPLVFISGLVCGTAR